MLTYWEINVPSSIEEAKKIFENRQIMLTDRTPLDELLQRYCDAHPEKDNDFALLYKFEFPVAECITAYEYLRKVNYNAAKLFPGYDGVVRDMDEFLLFCQVKKLI